MKTLRVVGCFLLLITPRLLLYYYCVQVESLIALQPDVCGNCKHPLREPEQVPGGSRKNKGDQKNMFPQLYWNFLIYWCNRTHYVGSALNGSQRSAGRAELQDGEMWKKISKMAFHFAHNFKCLKFPAHQWRPAATAPCWNHSNKTRYAASVSLCFIHLLHVQMCC